MRNIKQWLSILCISTMICTGCGNTAGASNNVENSTPASATEASVDEVTEPDEPEDKADQAKVDEDKKDDKSVSESEVVESVSSSEVDPSAEETKDTKDDSQEEASTGNDKKDADDKAEDVAEEPTVVELDNNSGSAQAVTVESVGSSPRNNVANALTPVASGTDVRGNTYVSVDVSNMTEGYMVVTYKGSSPKVKFQVTGPNNVAYNYNITTNAPAVIPFSTGSGNYKIGCYENVGGSQYAAVYTETIPVNIVNTFGPFLYPNQYVNFNASSAVVAKAATLCAGCGSDLEAVEAVYHFAVKNISYDYNKAATVTSGYLPVVDNTLSSKTGICFDYAALMAAMLRSQNIPTRLEIGYAKDAYHAWISVYIKDVGWIDGIIKFDGANWTLMDPTFASSSSSKDTKTFITTKSNYTVKYMY